WGVNAVNGVINVITRSAASTRGTLLAAGAGNLDSEAALRHGGAIGGQASYRVYAKYSTGDNSETAAGVRKDDAWYKSQAGFRTDWARAADTITVHGNAYRGAEGQPQPGSIVITGVSPPLGTISLSGANVTAQWSHALDGG